jgi:hypothetical protein
MSPRERNQAAGNGDEVFAFPDLVFKELLAVLIAALVLTVWSLRIDAPLKAIADPNWTENPAKAPWYFVGLQDLLVYFDPWIAGVGAPLLIIAGLAMLPYLDPNPRGVGAYRVRERPLVVPLFLFGYLMWFVLILIGQFLRGPNWQFYWPWEDWAVPKSAEQALVNLPNPVGLALLAAYFSLGLLLPAIADRGLFRKMRLVRHVIAWSLVLCMFGVVGKVILRFFFNVKYILTTPHFSI